MLFSTMGFSVNTLYCFCMGAYETSFFEIEHHCKKVHLAQTKTDTPKNACCEKMKSCHKKQDDNDCTKKNKKFFKADLKYLETEKIKLPEFTAFVILPTTSYYNFQPYNSEIRNPKSEIQDRPPPQLYGRKLLNFIQVYLC
jgi:hypothetical protein